MRYGIYAENLEHILPGFDVARIKAINVVELFRHNHFELFLNSLLYRFAVFPALLLGKSKEFTYGRCVRFVVEFGVLGEECIDSRGLGVRERECCWSCEARSGFDNL